VLSPEFRLVAACSWIPPSHLELEDSAEITSICAGQLDWQRVLYLVRIYGIQSLVYEVHSRHEAIAVPDAIMTVLKECRKYLVMNSLHRSSKLLRLHGKFRSKDVDIISFK